MHIRVFAVVLALVVVLALGWGGARIHRKGDFSFRIRKLQRRATELISKVMEFENESEYFALYKEPQEQQLIKKIEHAFGEVNENAVDVSERLRELEKRARSWVDFSDLYVDIGIQEEKLEAAEASFRDATVQLKNLPEL